MMMHRISNVLIGRDRVDSHGKSLNLDISNSAFVTIAHIPPTYYYALTNTSHGVHSPARNEFNHDCRVLIPPSSRLILLRRHIETMPKMLSPILLIQTSSTVRQATTDDRERISS